MQYYQYNYMLPPQISDAIARVVTSFAKEHDLKYELTRQGLPVWVVADSLGHRTNSVRIESITVPEGSLLSFTPDAYEDETDVHNGLIVLTRKLPSAEDIIAKRSILEVDRLVFQDTQPYQGEVDFVLWRRLADVWERAAELDLREVHTREMPLPLSS
ncbi:MAG: hypothetical protein HYX51_00370 [Chloroflexi bacterium]|nr:hypothetical protein [Chloroflexota bacterium]